MTDDQIKAKMQAASDQFDKLKAQGDEIESELKRLQGEYRAYEGMLSSAPDPATTIEAVPEPAKTKGKK